MVTYHIYFANMQSGKERVTWPCFYLEYVVDRAHLNSVCEFILLTIVFPHVDNLQNSNHNMQICVWLDSNFPHSCCQKYSNYSPVYSCSVILISGNSSLIYTMPSVTIPV